MVTLAATTSGVPETLLLLSVVLVAAKIGGALAAKARVPVVLGELAVGLILGSAGRAHLLGLPDLTRDAHFAFLAELGVILLLFEVGVENTVSRLMTVGVPALRVAILGMAAPFLLGWGVGVVLLPDAPAILPVFLGAALCATSVGITARVMKDAGRLDSTEGRTILGAAVLDDVLGLVVLAVVVRVASGDAGPVLRVASLAAGEAALFLGLSVGAGVLFSKPIFRLAARLRVSGMLLALSIALCFGFAWGAHAAGLAPIVGAFAAGLILEPAHSEIFLERGEEHSLEHLLHAPSALLVPVYFVHVGASIDPRALVDPAAIGLGVVLTVAALAGKLVSGLGGPAGADRLVVGLGMAPRGEVGLVFVSVGAGLVLDGEPLLDPRVAAALVTMVAATTLFGPLLLAARLRKGRASPPAA